MGWSTSLITILHVLPSILIPPISAQYIFIATSKIWTDAETYCVNTFGTHLASITDSIWTQNPSLMWTVNNTLNSTQLTQDSVMWIGLNDIDTEDVWVWSDGRTCSGNTNCKNDPNWFGSAPDNWNGIEHCAIINIAYFPPNYQDVPCGQNNPFLCNAPPTTSINPTINPTISPTQIPSNNPIQSPTNNPTDIPTVLTNNPSYIPTISPTKNPILSPTVIPSINPTVFDAETTIPSKFPTVIPSKNPTTLSPISAAPTYTRNPTTGPTESPITNVPTRSPIDYKFCTNNGHKGNDNISGKFIMVYDDDGSSDLSYEDVCEFCMCNGVDVLSICNNIVEMIKNLNDEMKNAFMDVCGFENECTFDRIGLKPVSKRINRCGCEIFECEPLGGANKSLKTSYGFGFIITLISCFVMYYV